MTGIYQEIATVNHNARKWARIGRRERKSTRQSGRETLARAKSKFRTIPMSHLLDSVQFPLIAVLQWNVAPHAAETRSNIIPNVAAALIAGTCDRDYLSPTGNHFHTLCFTKNGSKSERNLIGCKVDQEHAPCDRVAFFLKTIYFATICEQ